LVFIPIFTFRVSRIYKQEIHLEGQQVPHSHKRQKLLQLEKEFYLIKQRMQSVFIISVNTCQFKKEAIRFTE